MKKYGKKFVMSLIFITIISSSHVYANSSWHWLTVSPLDLLPIAIVMTLVIEVYLVKLLNKEFETKQLFKVIALANLMSFLAPYIERAYRFIPTSGGFSLTAAFNKGPFYMVMIGYLVLTLLIEIPIVFILLKKESLHKIRLLTTILVANVLTTGLVALLERTLAKGAW